MLAVMPAFEVLDARTVRREDGATFDVLDAIDALPWVHQLCPLMPHEYAVLFKSPELSWHAVEAMVRWSPDSYRAFFRGYQSPNRYWEAPDGLRYWRTGMMLNRCVPTSVEPLRRVDDGAKRIPGWNGPPWAPPDGSGWYVQDAKGRWWPRFEGTNLKPCKACAHPPKDLVIPPRAGSNAELRGETPAGRAAP